MKILFFGLALSLPVFASPLHLDLEMTSEEYRVLLKKMNQNKSLTKDEPSITRAINLGERLSKWISLVNEGRSSQTAIRLTSATTRRSFPIDKPNRYSPSLIEIETNTVLSDMPESIRSILTSTEDLPNSLPVGDEEFIHHARKLDRNYQQAARYKSVDQYRSEYIRAAKKDIRGYHYLTTNSIGENELRDRALIPAEKVKPIQEALSLICLNDIGNLDRCKKLTLKAFEENTLAQHYNKYIKEAKKNWDSFFKIPSYAIRSDVNWSDKVTVVPFNTPSIPKFIPYLQVNIEDEFRWNGWVLKLNFGSFSNGPLLKFEPGVVPHVNGLGGNQIIMDANQPIEEYESQWTIRHEFGHVIGLPDCYHEFYDTTENIYMSYQLDVTDLMCSRAGNMKERIFKELQSAYKK